MLEKDGIKKLGFYTDPSVSDVRINVPLTNLAIGYRNTGFIGSNVLPICDVEGESDKYFTFGQQNFNRQETVRAPGSDYNTMSFTMSNDSYTCEEYGLEYLLDDRVARNSNAPISMKDAITIYLQDALQLDYEDRVVALVGNTANYGASNSTTLVGGDQWDTYATNPQGDTSDPAEDIRAAIDAIVMNCGVYPTYMAMGWKVWSYLMYHPAILNEIRGRIDKVAGAARIQDIKDMFLLQDIFVGMGLVNTAAEGQTVVKASIWSDNVVFGFAPKVPAIMIPSFGYTFQVRGSLTVKTFRWKDYGEVIRVVQGIRDEKITSNVSGYVMTDVLGSI
jgi:hypothetical protein